VIPRPVKTVLLIDDDALLRDCTETILTCRGLKVHVAEDGEAGLARALELQPDAIVCDHDMPGMTGTEVFLALPPHLRERFLLWSGMAQPGFPEQGRVLEKPCETRLLLARLGLGDGPFPQRV